MWLNFIFHLCKEKKERWNTKRGNIENPLCVNNNTTFFFFLLGFDLDMQIDTSKRERRWSFTLKNESSNLDMLLVIENCIPLQKKNNFQQHYLSYLVICTVEHVHHRQTRFKLQASVWKASFNFEHLLNLFNKIRF